MGKGSFYLAPWKPSTCSGPSHMPHLVVMWLRPRSGFHHAEEVNAPVKTLANMAVLPASSGQVIKGN